MDHRALLNMLQVTDSTFPTGGFSHSMGLEAFADAGELRDAEELERVVGLSLDSMATSDCVALRAAHAAGSVDDLAWIDGLLSATKLSRELREASAATGRRFLASVGALGIEDAGLLGGFSRLVREGRSSGNIALGYGVAAPALGLGVEEVLRAYLYATTASLVSAGQKLVPLGGSAAQRTLYRLGEQIENAAKKSNKLEVEDMHAFAPLLDARSMLHERQRTRLYIS
jgi:urease accessory protein